MNIIKTPLPCQGKGLGDRVLNKTFLSINFGCRVNAAEINQLAQKYIDLGFTPLSQRGVGEISPSVILINTCSVTKKGDIESLSRIRTLSKKYPAAKIIATGCARIEKIKDLPHLTILTNNQKNNLSVLYSPQVKDKFSHTHRYLLKVQTGCTQMCSYCIVPYRRNTLWSLSLKEAVATVNQAVINGYTEVIITGVNLEEYKPGFSNLIEALLKNTDIKLISFGSVPLNCIDFKLLKLIKNFYSFNEKFFEKNNFTLKRNPAKSDKFRIKNFLHIPLQSGSDKILQLMNRPYNKEKILNTIYQIPDTISLGTDIIIGFPGETDEDFQQTLDLCKQIGFSKIHIFKFSPRPGTLGRILWSKSAKISPSILKIRSSQIRQTIHAD